MENKEKPTRSINFKFRYIDDILSLNKCKLVIMLIHIYLIEPEIKNTTDTDRSASYLDLYLENDNEARLREEEMINISM